VFWRLAPFRLAGLHTQFSGQNVSSQQTHKTKKKTGNCEENRSFVECGVILAIFVFGF